MTLIPTKTPDLVDAETLDRWHAARAQGIGASEAASALGFDEAWGDGPLEWWGKKTGTIPREEIDDDATKERMYWGHKREPELRAEVCERLPFVSQPYPPRDNFEVPPFAFVGEWALMGSVYRSDVPGREFMQATPDGFLECSEDIEVEPGFTIGKGETGLAEFKTSGAFMRATWTDDPPEHYLVQVWHSMIVFDLPWAIVAVSIGGNEFRAYAIQRLPAEQEAEFVEQLRTMWGYVESGEVPPVPEGGSPGWEKRVNALKKLHPDDDGEPMVLSPEIVKRLKRRETLREQVKKRAAEIKEIEGECRESMRKHAFGISPDGKFVATLKTQERSGYTSTVKPSKSRPLNITAGGKSESESDQ